MNAFPIFEVLLSGEEVELTLKAVQISISHLGRQIKTATGTRLENLRSEYKALASAEAELQAALAVFVMGGNDG